MSAQKRKKFNDVAPRPDIDEMEQSVLKYWEKEKTFEKTLDNSKEKPLFTFYDGPPYATGKPHYGHVLQSAIKDTVLRYKTMRGYHVPRRVGWDTHGLPVEVIVEKELGFKTKQDIEEYGIAEFNQKCREAVVRYIGEFTNTLQRLGRWADYEGGYRTLDIDYMESEWWVFRQLWDKNLVYKDFRSTPYCIRCATPLSNFETSMAYKDRHDTAVYVKLKVDQVNSSWNNPEDRERYSENDLYVLVWTTTPWTLSANVAVAYNPDLDYVVAEFNDELYLLAKDKVEAVLGSAATIAHDWSPNDFKDIAYEPLYPSVAANIGAVIERYGLVEGQHVTAEEGTGLVHIAPAFGDEDFQIGKANDLSILRTVDVNGKFLPGVEKWEDMSIWDANPEIITDLESRELLLNPEHYKHSYPHCWRCDEPLIYYAIDSWFVKVTDLKQRMLDANKDINWIPEHVKDGRFGTGIESAPDWAVSRNRFWSVPIPVWQCDKCDENVCIGSLDELKEKSGETEIKDMHRPYVDELTWQCDKCEGSMHRIEEVLDVWFDAGSMPYAQWHYPFENKELVEKSFPADFIVEAIEMTRLWFYVLHVLSVAVKDSPAYKNVIGSGIIFGEDGNKLSKKLKNYPDIEPTIEKYGADTIRMFFLLSTLGEPYVFSERELQQLFRNFTMTLWNVYGFFVQYANTHEWVSKAVVDEVESDNILDKWILARTKQLEHDVITATDEYRVDSAARAFPDFMDDLSNWYVRRSRERFQPRGNPEDIAFETLHSVLVRTTRLLAPFMPFVSEEIYRNLVGEKSVHLAEIGDALEVSNDEKDLLVTMKTAREIVSQGLAKRAKEGIKVRQPLSSLAAKGVSDLPGDVIDMIRDEVNVDEMTDGTTEEVELDLEITPELRSRGIAREVIRHGQLLRREAGYELDDEITLVLKTENEELQKIFGEQADEITKALQASSVTNEGTTDAEKEFKIEKETVTIGVKK